MKSVIRKILKNKIFITLSVILLCFLLIYLLLLAYQRDLSAKAPENALPILMYHHVVPDGEEINGMTVTREKLEADLKWIAENGYTSILPSELLTGQLPENPIIISFDDGYRSNYELLYPLLKEYNMKAVIAVIAMMPDIPSDNFCTWDMLKEMSDSGYVEIASHSYSLHNLDERMGEFEYDGANGVQRREGESDNDFKSRVLDDIDKSYERIKEEIGKAPCCFAYPFGASDESAKRHIDELFSVTFLTNYGIVDYSGSFYDLPRITVSMETELGKMLESAK